MKWKTWQQEDVTIKKQSNLSQDELINVARDEMNEQEQKKCDLSKPRMRLSDPPHQPSPNDEGWRNIDRIMLIASLSSVFHTKFTISDLKS